MGTWGVRILQDDLALDVYDEYIKWFNVQESDKSIRRRLLKEFGPDTFEDEDDGPNFWLALAKAQWDCGRLSKDVLREARRIADRGLGLERWAEEGPKALARRRAAIAKLIEQISVPNPEPRRPKRPTKRKPVFEPGDCLAVKLEDGDYGAALVVEHPSEDDNPAEETFGTNYVRLLKYKRPKPPSRAVFEARDWLVLSHHAWTGEPTTWAVRRASFKGDAKSMFTRIDTIPVFPSDVCEGGGLTFWSQLAIQIVMQDRWDRGDRT